MNNKCGQSPAGVRYFCVQHPASRNEKALNTANGASSWTVRAISRPPSIVKLACAAAFLFTTLPIAADTVRFSFAPGRPLGTDAQIFHDPSARMTVAEVLAAYRAGKFTPSPQQIPSLGFTSDQVWLALSITNDTPFMDWHVTVRYPAHDHVYFYSLHDDVVERAEELGDALPYRARTVPIRDFAFALNVPPGEERLIFISVRSWNSIVVPVYIDRLMPILQNADAETLVYGFYLGLVVVIALYNAFLFFSVRDLSYLYYVFYLLVFGAFQASFLGIALQYFLPDQPTFVDRMNPILGIGSFLTTALFAYQFLHLSRESRVLMWCFRILFCATLLAAPAVFIFGNRVVNLFGVFWPILLMTAGIWLWLRGFRPARFFVLAWSGFTLIVVLWTLTLRGWIANEILFRYGLLAGSSVEVILLSLALGDRINLLELDRQKAMRDQLETKTRLLDAFARFVPIQFIRFLGLDSIETVQLGDGVRRDVSVLFCDIRDFTALSETMSADENFRFINAYLKRVAPVIERHRGFIDKYIGDAVMAIFPDSPEDALNAAQEMLKELALYNDSRREKGLQSVRIGVGVHSGPVILGTVGTEGRLATTIIGDTVNVASRIEGQTKVLGHEVLFSEEARRRMGGTYSCREVGSVQVKGKTEPVKLFTMGVG